MGAGFFSGLEAHRAYPNGEGQVIGLLAWWRCAEPTGFVGSPKFDRPTTAGGCSREGQAKAMRNGLPTFSSQERLVGSIMLAGLRGSPSLYVQGSSWGGLTKGDKRPVGVLVMREVRPVSLVQRVEWAIGVRGRCSFGYWA
ncbi:hypothetical protein CDL15_Pgr021885 [Punica granatum]|uniref:Uncharacterized protein n=1 Tax=Punica granatum TaxID=22663 RepID=A0A218WTN3_PUNGR|nr:hypothetical protein CDL15_Pgr021885 [Punica granatum]PKI54552.1 hypothetical protein CRG98_025066 [Punica granatum]